MQLLSACQGEQLDGRGTVQGEEDVKTRALRCGPLGSSGRTRLIPLPTATEEVGSPWRLITFYLTICLWGPGHEPPGA